MARSPDKCGKGPPLTPLSGYWLARGQVPKGVERGIILASLPQAREDAGFT